MGRSASSLPGWDEVESELFPLPTFFFCSGKGNIPLSGEVFVKLHDIRWLGGLQPLMGATF